MTLKQLENLSPPIMKQVIPLVEQLPPLYMDLVKGREDFAPKPEETRRLVCKTSSYCLIYLIPSVHMDMVFFPSSLHAFLFIYNFNALLE